VYTNTDGVSLRCHWNEALREFRAISLSASDAVDCNAASSFSQWLQLHGLSKPFGEPREEIVSQGGGVSVSLSGGDERSEPESAIVNSCPATSIDLQGVGPVACARAARHATALPCLDTNNCNKGKNERSESLASAHRKTAYALKLNVLLLTGRFGLERIGFLTLTFARYVVSYKEAQKALHSLMTGVLKKRYPEYIIVMERMDSKRIHFHLLVVMAQDIRTGFDFAAVKRGDYRSAGGYLRREWKFWRESAPKYGFGRTELLPIRKTAEGVAKYVGKYVAKHIGQRLAEDKGARLVRYSRGTNRASTGFAWNSPGAAMWRAKLGTFCQMLGLTSDNYTQFLGEWFGQNWVYHLRPLINSIKLPEFYPLEEASASLKGVWLAAIKERERCCGRRHRETKVPLPAESGRVWASWIERTLKED
jgi:hypothetical protein